MDHKVIKGFFFLGAVAITQDLGHSEQAFYQSYILKLTYHDSLFAFYVLDRVSVCSSGCPETHYVYQTGLEFTVFYLPLPLKC